MWGGKEVWPPWIWLFADTDHSNWRRRVRRARDALYEGFSEEMLVSRALTVQSLWILCDGYEVWVSHGGSAFRSASSRLPCYWPHENGTLRRPRTQQEAASWDPISLPKYKIITWNTWHLTSTSVYTTWAWMKTGGSRVRACARTLNIGDV